MSGTVTSFSDRTTAPVLTYSYKVAAIDAAGNLSDQSSATPPVTTPATGPTVAAADGYGRTVSGGWGSADAGGARTGTDSTFSVNGSQGRIGLTKGATKNAYLASATGANTELFVGVRVDHTGLQSGSSVIGTYVYDGAGNRFAKTAGGVTTVYGLDLASSLPQVLTETAGSSLTTYTYAGGPLEIDKAGTTYWYLTDTLGSVRLVTDSTGASPATYAYAAFGSTRKSSGTLANEVRFTGQRTDRESGLEFLRARTYDPSTGTFLQRDSWGISPTDSQSLGAYAYTANNPINATDPSGHMYMHEGGRDVSPVTPSPYIQPISSGGAGGPATPPSVATLKTRSGAYLFCLSNYANNQSGTGPDFSQQQMLCQATVAQRFDKPPPEDIGAELLGICLVLCTVVVASAAVVGLGEVSPWVLARLAGGGCATAAKCQEAATEGAGIVKPATSNPALQNLVNDLYKPGAQIGTGSTADAIRYTAQTGQLIGGSDHVQKGWEYLSALDNWLASHPGASQADIDAAHMLANDLLHALRP